MAGGVGVERVGVSVALAAPAAFYFILKATQYVFTVNLTLRSLEVFIFIVRVFHKDVNVNIKYIAVPNLRL